MVRPTTVWTLRTAVALLGKLTGFTGENGQGGNEKGEGGTEKEGKRVSRKQLAAGREKTVPYAARASGSAAGPSPLITHPSLFAVRVAENDIDVIDMIASCASSPAAARSSA